MGYQLPCERRGDVNIAGESIEDVIIDVSKEWASIWHTKNKVAKPRNFELPRHR